MNLINPTTLRSILQNVSLHLPEGYELIAGTRAENIHLYYNLITVTVLGNVHFVKIVIRVPLNTVDRHFTMYNYLSFLREFLTISLLNTPLNILVLV